MQNSTTPPASAANSALAESTAPISNPLLAAAPVENPTPTLDRRNFIRKGLAALGGVLSASLLPEKLTAKEIVLSRHDWGSEGIWGQGRGFSNRGINGLIFFPELRKRMEFIVPNLVRAFENKQEDKISSEFGKLLNLVDSPPKEKIVKSKKPDEDVKRSKEKVVKARHPFSGEKVEAGKDWISSSVIQGFFRMVAETRAGKEETTVETAGNSGKGIFCLVYESFGDKADAVMNKVIAFLDTILKKCGHPTGSQKPDGIRWHMNKALADLKVAVAKRDLKKMLKHESVIEAYYFCLMDITTLIKEARASEVMPGRYLEGVSKGGFTNRLTWENAILLSPVIVKKLKECIKLKTGVFECKTERGKTYNIPREDLKFTGGKGDDSCEFIRAARLASTHETASMNRRTYLLGTNVDLGMFFSTTTTDSNETRMELNEAQEEMNRLKTKGISPIPLLETGAFVNEAHVLNVNSKTMQDVLRVKERIEKSTIGTPKPKEIIKIQASSLYVLLGFTKKEVFFCDNEEPHRILFMNKEKVRYGEISGIIEAVA